MGHWVLLIRVRVLERMTGNPGHSSFGWMYGEDRRRHRTACLSLGVRMLKITSVANLTIPVGPCQKREVWSVSASDSIGSTR